MTMDDAAKENWDRYCYGKDRGHVEYMVQAMRCEGMYLGGGEQWLEADKNILRAQRRPFYEFNEIMPSTNSAIGYQIHNRMDIAFRPRGGDADMETATVLSKVAMQIADAAMYHWHETQAFSDGLIQQRGYFDLRVVFDRNFKGDITLATLDPLDVIPDPDAKTYDPDGWGDVTISRWLTAGEVGQIYGEDAQKKVEASQDHGDDFGTMDGQDVERNKFGTATLVGLSDAYRVGADGIKRYRIIDRQKFVYEKTQCVVFPQTGDVKTAADMTPAQVQEALAKGAVMASRMRRRVKWIVSTWCVTLHNDYSPYEHFTVVPYFAYFRRGKTRGMVDNAIGPQEALNKGVSQFVHIINTSANSGWKVEEESLTNMDAKELEEKGAMTGLVLEFKKGSRIPDKIEPNPVPTGVDRLIDRATQALKDVTVPEAMRGNEGAEVSGVAIQAKQHASQQQLAVPLDNLAYTRQLLAVRLVKLIQKFYDDYRVFRITETDPMTGKEVETPLEINKFDPMTGKYLNDITLGTYDVVITEQPMQVTFENSQFNQAIEMRKAGIAIPDSTVIRYSNLSDKHEILESMQPAPADPTLQAKAKLLEAQARKTDAETTATNVEAQFSGMQAAQVIATVPQAAPLADALLRSAGYIDHDAAPIVPAAQGMAAPPADIPQNTSPMFPARPESADAGLSQGIETARADSVVAE